MTDFATLGIKVDSSQTKAAAGDLDKLAAAGGRAERGVNALGLEYVQASSAAGQLRIAQLGAVGSANGLAGAATLATRSAGQQRAGFQQLGFQLNDFTTQVSAGTSVTQALAQQLGQTTQALQLMGGGRGALGAVAGFLGGPWGIALSVGLIALVPFISKLFEGKSAADEFTQALFGTKSQAESLAASLRAVQGLKKADIALDINAVRIKVNQLKEREFGLERIISNRPAKGAAGSLGFALGVGSGAAAELRQNRAAQFELNAQILTGEANLRAADKTTKEATKSTGAYTRAVGGGGRSSGGGGRSGGGGGGGLTGALSESQRATEAATKATDSFIAKLEEEISKMGKSEQQLRAMEIARAREGAATEAQRQRIDELNAAREREIARTKIATAVLADLAERRKSLEDSFDGAVEQATDRLKKEDERKQKAADDYANSLRDLVGLLDQIGGKTGRTLADIGAIFTGLTTGDFRGVRGAVGSAIGLLANTPVGTKEDGSVKKLGDRIVEIFDSNGRFAKTFKGILEGAGTGTAVAGILFGNNKSAQIGGAIGGAIGKTVGGPIGSVIGSVIGSSIGNAVRSVKSGSATLGFTNGELGISGTGGNSGSRQKQASSLGNNISGALGKIADQLGGTLDGPISLSIGVRDGSIRVDPTGKGATKKSKGAIDFGKDEAAALKFAIADAIKDGAISGLSAGVSALLKRGTDIEAQISKAIKFQSVFDQLKERTDPLGFAMEQLGREAESLKKIFAEAGAGASEYAQLEQLLALKRADAAKDAGGAANALKAFLLDLNAGPASPLSLRQQKNEAEAALAPFSAAIASAQAARAQADAIKASGGSASAIGAAEQAARIASGKIDQDGFQSAAQRLLGISRAGDASGAGFFAEFDRIRALTQAGIGLIDRPQDLTPQIAQNTADTANLLVDNNELLKTISAQLQAMNDNGTIPPGWFDATRSFA